MTGAELIAAERQRQITEEGWTPEHDDAHEDGELARAAICYAMTDTAYLEAFWPWDEAWWKPTDPVRDLVKAGALIAAEIDRLQRLNEAEAPVAAGASLPIGPAAEPASTNKEKERSA